MSEAINGVLVVTYGDYRIPDFDALPIASKLALAQSGLTHKLGNEVASAVSARIKNAIVEASGDPKHETTKDETKAFRAANAALVAEWTKAEADETFAEILAGTIGTASRGPRGPKLDEFASLTREYCTREVGEAFVKRQLFAKNSAGDFVLPGTNTKPVSGGKNPWTIEIGGKSYTFAAVVDAQLAKPEVLARHQASAKKELDRRAAQASKVSADVDLEALI